MKPRYVAGACVLGVYLLGMGFLGGTIYSATRFDERRAVILSELEHTSSRVRAKLMRLEHDTTQSAAVR